MTRTVASPSPCPAPSPEGSYGEPFRIAAVLNRSRVNYKICSVYDLSPERVGVFDLVFCGSMLMHLKNPMAALGRIASVCGNCLVITTQTEIGFDGDSAARYLGHDIPFVHFVPSPDCIANMLKACGFAAVLRGPTFYLRFRDRQANQEALCHTSLVCLKDPEHPCIDIG